MDAEEVFTVSDAWRHAYPGACAGILIVSGASVPSHPKAFEQEIDARERALRDRFASADRAALRGLPALAAYAAHYAGFKKTYHVQLQLESVVKKGRALPREPVLVASMIAAELTHLLLTAGHDLDALRLPITLHAAAGTERYVMLSGEEQTAKPGDMLMADCEGVISSVVYGPDHRTRITGDTRDALFAVYAPAGIGEDAVTRHLEDLASLVRLASPVAEVTFLHVSRA